MTIQIPDWLLTILKYGGIGILVVLAMLGVLFLLFLKDLRFWVALLTCFLCVGLASCASDVRDPNDPTKTKPRWRLNGSLTACYEGVCLTYDPRDVNRPGPVEPLPLPQRVVKDSGK